MYQKFCHNIKILFNIEIKIYSSICFASHLHWNDFISLVMNFEKNLVETVDRKRDFEKSSIAYKERLTSLHNWKWIFSNDFIKEDMIVVEFRDIEYECIAKCIYCWLMLFDDDCKKSLTKHLRKSFYCSLVIQFEKKISKVIKRTKLKVIEVAKSISTFVNIDIFDSTLMRDIEQFDLYSKMLKYLQHFQQIQHQYRESNVFDLLFKCFRNFAFEWFNNQLNFIIIQNFDKDLTCAFSIFIEFATKTSNQLFITFDSSISNSSSQYHSFVDCFVYFSLMIWLLKHIKQINCSKVIYKHCEQNFNFKNKFHDHIREQHTQKSNLRFFTSEFTYKIMKKSTVAYSSISSILFVTSKSIFCFASIFESILSKCSHFSIAILNITLKSMKKLSVNYSFTFSISSFRTFVSKHQKSYLIIDDLIRMFRKKSKSFEISQHQKRDFFRKTSTLVHLVNHVFFSCINHE